MFVKQNESLVIVGSFTSPLGASQGVPPILAGVVQSNCERMPRRGLGQTLSERNDEVSQDRDGGVWNRRRTPGPHDHSINRGPRLDDAKRAVNAGDIGSADHRRSIAQ